MTIEERLTNDEADAFLAIAEDRAVLARFPLIRSLVDRRIIKDHTGCRIARIVAQFRDRQNGSAA